MFGKRGEISLITLLEVTMGMMLVILFFSAASTLSDQERINEFARAKDIALLVDTLQGVGYDVDYTYPETSFGTNVRIENYVVTVIPDTLRVPRPEFFSTSQYGFDVGSPNNNILPAVVNGAYFVINKEGNTLSFHNESSYQRQESLATTLSRKDVTLYLLFENQASGNIGNFLSRTTNTVQGELQQSFRIGTNATHYLGFSYGDQSIIYYSDHSTMQTLAQQLQRRFELSGISFTLIKGSSLFGEGKEAIEIQLTSQSRQRIEQRLPIFAVEVRQTYENFFEE